MRDDRSAPRDNDYRLDEWPCNNPGEVNHNSQRCRHSYRLTCDECGMLGQKLKHHDRQDDGLEERAIDVRQSIRQSERETVGMPMHCSNQFDVLGFDVPSVSAESIQPSPTDVCTKFPALAIYRKTNKKKTYNIFTS